MSNDIVRSALIALAVSAVAAAAPVITAVQPSDELVIATVGAAAPSESGLFVVMGSGFSNQFEGSAPSITATIAGVDAPVLLATQTLALVQVPGGITIGVIGLKSVPLVVTVDGAASAPFSVTVSKTGTPKITAVEPAQATVGAEVIITGNDLGGLSGLPPVVRFGGVAAERAFSMGMALVTWVPAGVSAGAADVTVEVETSTGTLTSPAASFTVTATPQPAVLFHAPQEGPPGELVFLNGADLGAEGATTTVTIGGAAAEVVFAGQALAVAVVPAGAAQGAGDLVVTVAGTSSAPVAYTVQPAAPPVIEGFQPANGVVGTPVLIKGANLGSISAVPQLRVGGSSSFPALPFSNDAVLGVVPPGATTGPLGLTVGSYPEAFSAAAFTVDPTPVPTPVVAALMPASAPPGAMVRLLGVGFGPDPAQVDVRFNGVAATVLTGGRLSLAVTVPAGATSGDVTVTRTGGSPSAGVAFTVTAPADPAISGFSKDPATVGRGLVISGTGFFVAGQPPSVTFSGSASAVTTAWRTNTELFVTVPTGAASGPVTVTVNGRTSTAATLGIQ